MALSDLSQSAELLYRIQFDIGDTGAVPSPAVDRLQGPLIVGTTGIVDEGANPPRGPFPDVFAIDNSALQPDGLHLRITRPTTLAAGIASVICALPATSVHLRRFRIAADFQINKLGFRIPIVPSAAGDLWAPIIVARDGDLEVTAGTTVIGATHQVLGGSPPRVTLGAGSGAKNISPPAVSVTVPILEAHDASGHFTLGAYFDRFTGEGQSTLSTSNGYYWENRWHHPFTLAADGTPMTCIGFGLAMARGFGTPEVTVKEFRVLAWPEPIVNPPPPVIEPPIVR